MKLTNADYEQIMREYDSKQYKSNFLLEKRKKEIYTAIPKFKLIEDELTSLSANFAKNSVTLSPEAYKKSSEEFLLQKKNLIAQKNKLLEENGFPIQYLTTIYECESCHDTGFISGIKCHCFEESVLSLMERRDYVTKIPKNALFQNFKLEYYSDADYHIETEKSSRENATSILSLAKEFVNHFASTRGNIIFYGNTGTGKTFLASCIANELLKGNFSVRFITSYQFFSLMEKFTFSKNVEDYTRVRDCVDDILNCDLLILDDIGTESINNFTQTKFYEFINERIIEDKSTIITTNFDPITINHFYGERILSRLTGNYTFIKLTGEDIRLSKHKRDLD